MKASHVTSPQRGSASAIARRVLDRHRRRQPPLDLAPRPVRGSGQPPPARQLAQQLEQPEVGPRRGLRLVDRRLPYLHRSRSDRRPQHRLELAERRLALGDPAQVVLVEVQPQRGRQLTTVT
jgi:hypothetical protein